jgi:hypothetical protein
MMTRPFSKRLAVAVVVAVVVIASANALGLSQRATARANPALPPIESRIALLYQGSFADEDSYRRLAILARNDGFTVVPFDSPRELVFRLPEARAVIVGGTVDDIKPLIASFSPRDIDALRRFIADGGRYLGICGGAYLVSRGWQDGDAFTKALSIIPAQTANFHDDPASKIIPVIWRGNKRMMFYQLGPSIAPDAASSPAVIATYGDGAIAAAKFSVGRGSVYVVGPHPEADATWVDNSTEHAERWRSTNDLAEEMLRDATR